MVEATVALALLIGGLALAALPSHVGMWGAAIVTALALITGIVASIIYHARLRAALRPRHLLPRHWWVHPLPLHGHLEELPRERDRVLTPFYVGVACAVVSLSGAVIGSVFAVRAVLF